MWGCAVNRAGWLDLRSRYRNACLADRGENNARAVSLQSDPLRRTCAPFWPTRRWQAAVVDSLPPVLRVQLQQKPATTDELDPRSRNLRAVVRFHAGRRHAAVVLRDAQNFIANAKPICPAPRAVLSNTPSARGASSIQERAA